MAITTPAALPRSTAPWLALAMSLAIAGPAFAQTATPEAREPTDVGAITVVAPRITYQVVRDRTTVRRPAVVEIVEKRAEVTFADLDLTRSSDLFTLEDRVRQAASRVCEDLAREHPEGEPSTEICTRRATDDALAQVRRMSRRATGM